MKQEPVEINSWEIGFGEREIEFLSCIPDFFSAFENDLKKRITKENEELQKEKEKKLEEIRKKTKETKKSKRSLVLLSSSPEF